MLTPLTEETAAGIRNPDLARYARHRLALDREFLDAVEGFGLERATESEGAEAWIARLQELGVFGENDGKSFRTGWISPACVACRMGVDTETFLTSTQCPRKCFFCFNPNQEDYEYFLTHDNDIAQQLMDRFRAGARFRFLGITGGEPLLHYERVLDFLDVAGVLAPDAYTRLYTSGAGLTPARAREMAEAGLDEVRFSIKVEDSPAARERVLQAIGESVGVFDAVMVEMPVAPDQVAFMKDLLVHLDALGVRGINLLELCFPFHNAGEFAKRGYRIKETPYRIPYDYWYAGGLPIAGSESACLELVAFAAERGLKLGVHYCSLENKLTGQIYQQNRFTKLDHPRHELSPRDYFLKAAKVFGRDCARAKAVLAGAGVTALLEDAANRCLEFPISAVPLLAKRHPLMEVAITSCVAEEREEGPVLRELALALTTTAGFDATKDL